MFFLQILLLVEICCVLVWYSNMYLFITRVNASGWHGRKCWAVSARARVPTSSATCSTSCGLSSSLRSPLPWSGCSRPTRADRVSSHQLNYSYFTSDRNENIDRHVLVRKKVTVSRIKVSVSCSCEVRHVWRIRPITAVTEWKERPPRKRRRSKFSPGEINCDISDK